MLAHPADAADAAQEILIRVITHLGSFRGDANFMTWVYRVAANHLISVKRSRVEQQAYTFERFGDEHDRNLSDLPLARDLPVDEALLLAEVRMGCTLGMLTRLDRPQRIAYILGEILEMESDGAASILDISPAAFRKRLSRARAGIIKFMQSKCGLANPGNACHCRRRVDHAMRIGRADPRNLQFAHDPADAGRFPAVLREIRKLQDAQRTVALYRSHPEYAAPENFAGAVRALIANN